MTESGVRTAVAAPPEDFRAMMSGFPTGVTVVTATDKNAAQWGMTCSSVCSVSLEPPVLLVCLRSGSPTLDAVLASGSFAVNMLHSGARATAELFASGNPRRFEMVPWEAGPNAAGPHLTKDIHTVADCEVMLTQRVGDHTAVYGTARRISRHGEMAPLLYGLREFRGWPRAGAPEGSAAKD